MTRPGGRPLRKGITTGTSAAAAAKAAATALFSAFASGGKGAPGAAARGRGAREGRVLAPGGYVNVTLPRGGVIRVKVKSLEVEGTIRATASVIKYSGDDPDVTNGAEISATVELRSMNPRRTGVAVRGGSGVGVVTRPGLKTPVGSAAINPVPRMMIMRSVREAAGSYGLTPSVVVTVTVPRGEVLAKKTMNPRLGITGGISILGTTGIVEPLSLSAYTHSIFCAVDVALAASLTEVVFSTGRSSEKAVEESLGLPEYAYVLTGDHMGAALDYAASRKGLKRVTVAGQFGKFTKLAGDHFATHCSDSSVELASLAGICRSLGLSGALVKRIENANTAREAFFIIEEASAEKVFKKITEMVRDNSRRRIGPGKKVRAVLVGYDGKVVATV